MSSTAEQINKDILVIANITDETSTSSDSIFNASNQLQGLATSIEDVLSVFSLGDSVGRALPAGKDQKVAQLGSGKEDRESPSLEGGLDNTKEEAS